MVVFKVLLCILGGYALGLFTTGVFVARYIGKTDIREHGSGSVGTTNVLRTLGWLPSLLTLVGDALKGFLAAWIGWMLLGDMGARLMGLFCVIGHIYPITSHFKGGKGIATGLGLLLFVDPWIVLALAALQVVVIVLTRYMGLASIISCVLYAVIATIVHWGDGFAIAFAIVFSALLIFAHRGNIKRLREGTENRLDFSKIKKFTNQQ